MAGLVGGPLLVGGLGPRPPGPPPPLNPALSALQGTLEAVLDLFQEVA